MTLYLLHSCSSCHTLGLTCSHRCPAQSCRTRAAAAAAPREIRTVAALQKQKKQASMLLSRSMYKICQILWLNRKIQLARSKYKDNICGTWRILVQLSEFCPQSEINSYTLESKADAAHRICRCRVLRFLVELLLLNYCSSVAKFPQRTKAPTACRDPQWFFLTWCNNVSKKNGGFLWVVEWMFRRREEEAAVQITAPLRLLRLLCPVILMKQGRIQRGSGRSPFTTTHSEQIVCMSSIKIQ